jgi:hypothetical protein
MVHLEINGDVRKGRKATLASQRAQTTKGAKTTLASHLAKGGWRRLPHKSTKGSLGAWRPSKGAEVQTSAEPRRR